jgi:hypothetical protein
MFHIAYFDKNIFSKKKKRKKRKTTSPNLGVDEDDDFHLDQHF